MADTPIRYPATPAEWEALIRRHVNGPTNHDDPEPEACVQGGSMWRGLLNVRLRCGGDDYCGIVLPPIPGDPIFVRNGAAVNICATDTDTIARWVRMARPIPYARWFATQQPELDRVAAEWRRRYSLVERKTQKHHEYVWIAWRFIYTMAAVSIGFYLGHMAG